MKQINLKKRLLPNLPYVFIGLYATKLGQIFRLSPGSDLSSKLLHIGDGFAAAFASAAPSFHPADLCVGILLAALMRLAVYIKGKNAKKYRKNMEYGSARWGNPEDIAPFMDPKFENNVILTQTERLMMSNRPKDPKNARNKNVLIIGGSGSGKTRFWLKPNLMQCHSSYVVTDPKGSILVECGKLLEHNREATVERLHMIAVLAPDCETKKLFFNLAVKLSADCTGHWYPCFFRTLREEMAIYYEAELTMKLAEISTYDTEGRYGKADQV